VNWEQLGHLTNEPVPGHLRRWWFALGGTAAFLFGVQILTGILLLFYYVPEPGRAYESVHRISHEVPLGWWIRSLHKWAASGMIIAVCLHTLRVFFTASYRRPRELTWVVGCFLLFATLGERLFAGLRAAFLLGRHRHRQPRRRAARRRCRAGPPDPRRR
jgi:quinol-cytochrome oxidoreductase complex cytochrome b subunit